MKAFVKTVLDVLFQFALLVSLTDIDGSVLKTGTDFPIQRDLNMSHSVHLKRSEKLR